MDVETSYSDFINCDRTGRRNAVPDITGEETGTASTSELTKDLAEMDLKAAGQYMSPGIMHTCHWYSTHWCEEHSVLCKIKGLGGGQDLLVRGCCL